MWKNTVEPGRQKMTTWRIPIAYWVTEATYTQRIAFLVQQWFQDCVPLLRHTYFACLPCYLGIH
jgi:hypothetical protein